MAILGYGEESVSVGFEEVSSSAWRAEVYQPDILSKPATLYKKPGYTM
jgi:4-oxalocrotonate tautomerase